MVVHGGGRPRKDATPVASPRPVPEGNTGEHPRPPVGGSSGSEKYMARVTAHFFWPLVAKDPRAYCRACKVCQRLANQPAPRAPLCPLPVVGEPFTRIAMDLVGPLPRTQRGAHYLLVLMDCPILPSDPGLPGQPGGTEKPSPARDTQGGLPRQRQQSNSSRPTYLRGQGRLPNDDRPQKRLKRKAGL